MRPNSPVILALPLWAFGVILLPGCAGNGGGDLSGARGRVVHAALAEVGTAYVYGGQSPGRALDCSALTRHAYASAGLEIPRESRAQHRGAKAVRLRDARPGDLLFFRTGPGGYHVGLLVEEGRFVHASTSASRVRISSLESPYWRGRLAGAGTYLD